MISYCDDCGEYQGDYVDGKLYKFGKLVTEDHLCPGQPCDDSLEEIEHSEGE